MVGPPRGSGVAPPEYVMDALERAQALPETTDALDAEMLVSDVAGWCALAARDAGADEEHAWDELIAAAGARRSRRGAALLRGLAALLPEPAAGHAAAAIAPDAYRPPWTDAIAALTPETCWYGTGEENTGYAFVLASYTYDGAEPHAVAVSIDHANDGVAKDVFVTAGNGIEVTRDRLSGFCADFGEVDPATAHDHLAKAYAATDRAGEPDDDTASLRAFCLRRARAFGDA